MNFFQTGKLTKETKELFTFLLVTYGITLLLGILVAISRTGNLEGISSVPGMISPAVGVILAKLIFEKENPLLPKHIFIGVLVFSGIFILLRFFSVFVNSIDTKIVELFFFIEFFVLCALYLLERKTSRSAYGLSGENWKVVWGGSGLFLILMLIANALFAFVTKNISPGAFEKIDLLNIQMIVSSVITVIFSIPSCFQEEYGWRYFLQPYFQKKFGLIKGVILVGVFWELWHLPVVLFTIVDYDPNMTLLQLLVTRFVSTISLSIFIGFIYMKTKNIWAAVFIHSLHNSFPHVLNSFVWPRDEKEGCLLVLFYSLISIVVFFPLLLSKLYRARKF